CRCFGPVLRLSIVPGRRRQSSIQYFLNRNATKEGWNFLGAASRPNKQAVAQIMGDDQSLEFHLNTRAQFRVGRPATLLTMSDVARRRCPRNHSAVITIFDAGYQ